MAAPGIDNEKETTMKTVLMASAALIIVSNPALAQGFTTNEPAQLTEGQKSIVELVSEGFEIKGTVGPLIILQDDKSLFGCSAARTGPADIKTGVIPAQKIPCVPIK
jgi:hypothetical protein